MRNRVRKASGEDVVHVALGVQRRVDAALLEHEREVQARRAGSDDPDVRHGQASLQVRARRNEIRGTLADHQRGRVRVARGDERHDRRVRHPQALDPVDPELWIDDGQLVDAHLARADLVVIRDRRRADVVPQRLPRACAFTRIELGAAPLPERGLASDLAAQLDGGHQGVDIGVTAQVRRVDERRNARIAGGERERAAARGPDHPGHQRVAVGRALHALEVERQVEEERLQVGAGKARPAVPEQMAVQLLQARQHRGHRRRGCVDHRRQHVVVQVAADTGQVGDHVDSEPAQVCSVADAGEQQELGRLDRAGTDDDLMLGVRLLDDPVRAPAPHRCSVFRRTTAASPAPP